MVDIAAVSYLLSSIASIGKIIEFSMGMNKDISESEIKKAREEAAIYGKQKVQAAPLEAIAKSFMMSDQIIETIRRNIDEAGVEVADAIDNFKKLPESVARERLFNARRRFCWGIHQIKFHSGGTLPPDMQQEWDRSVCDIYKFD